MLRRSARLLARAAVNPNAGATTRIQFSTDALEVRHDRRLKEFFISMSSERAVLQYDDSSSNIMDLVHTEVPAVFQGKGVGKILAKAAFDYVHTNNLKMKLTCDYLQKIINNFPEYQHIVVK